MCYITPIQLTQPDLQTLHTGIAQYNYDDPNPAKSAKPLNPTHGYCTETTAMTPIQLNQPDQNHTLFAWV